MRNNRAEAFETRLAEALGDIDSMLEARFGQTFARHPVRPAQGQTAKPQYDGLFSLIANYTAGFGSRFGHGYTLSLQVATLAPVPESLRREWEAFAAEQLRRRLPALFPNRHLAVDLDVHGWKLHGDLSLDNDDE